MKKLFDEDDNEFPGMEKAKILVTVIPFVLIILILAVTLIVNGVKKGENKNDDLQQSIMDYADENKEAQAAASALPANSSSAVSEKDENQENVSSQENESNQKEESIQAATPYKEVMEAGRTDYSKVEFHKEEQLRDMMAYWADNNQKAINDLVYLDHYIAMSWSLKGTDDFYYYGDTDANGNPSGKGIAVYADNQYYYGDWAGGVRSGTGTWIHYHIHFTTNSDDLYTYHHYTGSWANDLPDGEGSEHYDYDMSLLKGNDGYLTNLIGSYSEGLVNGDFYLINIYADQSTKEWNARADHGSWIYQNENKDKKGNRTVYVEIGNPDNYVWMHPGNNVNIGVPCLISKNAKTS